MKKDNLRRTKLFYLSHYVLKSLEKLGINVKFLKYICRRLYLVHLVLNLLEELEIEVRLLNDKDFEAELSEDPIYSRIPKELAKELRLAKITCGSSRKEIPSVNVDCLLREIHKYEEEKPRLAMEEKIIIMFSTSLHEHGEAKMGYTDCDNEGCPMKGVLEIRPNLNLDPCPNHTELQEIISEKSVQNLID